MLKLKFNLRHQDIQLVNKGVVVATDSKDYLVAKFNPVSDDWEVPLTAVFTDDKHKQPYAVIVGADERLAENECFVPWEVLTDECNVYVSVYCGNLHTTVTAAFKVRKSGYIEGETPPPPSPTVYDIIMQAIADLQVGKQDKLTAGENITIDENGVISAEGGVTSYVDLDNKTQINGHELVGNKTGDSLGLQGKLTAGENITINANGRISATGGTDDYEELTNKPLINGHELVGNKTSEELGINRVLQNTTTPPIYTSSSVNYEVGDVWVNNATNISYVLMRKTTNDLFWRQLGIKAYLSESLPPKSENLNFNNLRYQAGDIWIHRAFYNHGTKPFYYLNGLYICVGSAQQSEPPYNQYNIKWYRIDGHQIQSATINQDGTITFTMSDGSTVTTTGESVIGPQGPAGADGQQGPAGADWVPTETELNDIAQRAVNLIPTTQGVLYGNTSN